MPEVKEIDKKFQTIDAMGPFSSLIKSCKAESMELHHNELVVAIFGSLKVGKSTLGNLLLDKPIFESADAPMTSFVTTFHSSADKKCSKASFVPFIETEDDIKSLLLVAGIDDPELEQKYRDLFTKDGYIEGEKLPEFVSRPPPQLRHTPIISHVDIYGSIWDITQKGIAIADCPGTKEIGALTNISHQVASDAAVILFVCDDKTKLSLEDEDVQLIRRQLEDGADVMFVLNKKPDSTDSGLLSVSSALGEVFGDLVDFNNDSPIHILDIKGDQALMGSLQRELAARLHQRTRTAVTVFLNFFTELIRAQHLFVSRLLTLHVSKQAETMREKAALANPKMSSSNNYNNASNQPVVDIRKKQADDLAKATKRASERYKAEVKSIQSRMNAMWKACKSKIEDAGLEFDKVVTKTATEFEDAMKQNYNYLAVPVPVAFTPESAPPRSFIGSMFDTKENLFEKEFRRQLQMRLHPKMVHNLNVFGRSVKHSFVHSLMVEFSSIESKVVELKAEQAKLLWNRQSQGLFTRLRQDLAQVAVRPQKVAGVALSAVGIVGAAALSGIALTGLLAGTVLTGGVFLIVALLATGAGLSAASLFKETQTESSESKTRKSALKRLTVSIKSSLSNEHFTAFRKQTLGSLDAILSAAMHAVSTNLIEMESVWYLDQCNIVISYETLCQYLWLRDELTEVTNFLLDTVRSLSVSLQVSQGPLSINSLDKSGDFDLRENQKIVSPRNTGLNSSGTVSLSGSGGIPMSSSHNSLSSLVEAHHSSHYSHLNSGHQNSTHTNTLVMKLDRQKIQENARHDSCYVCWRQRTPCGHLCRDCDFLIGAENCPYCHELPHWIADKIKLSPKAKKDLETLLKGAPPQIETVVESLSRQSSSIDLGSLLSSSSQNIGSDNHPLSSKSTSSNQSETNEQGEGGKKEGESKNSGKDAKNSGNDAKNSASGLSSLQMHPRFPFDEEKQRVQSILVAFKSQFAAFCSWFESKYRRYVTEPAEPDLDVPEDVLGAIKYFVNSIISEISSTLYASAVTLTYAIKQRIIECTHEIIFGQVGPLVDALVRNRYKQLDEEHFEVCKRGENIRYERVDRKDWSPSKADALKMQQAIETMSSMSQAKSPFAKFQVWKQVWTFIHQAHSEIISADDSWAALTYVIIHAGNAHMVSDGFIVNRSLELLLEGEAYMLTTISTFSSPTLIGDVVDSELSRESSD